MPVVATSKEPSKKHIRREATVAWLQRLFSNRNAMSPRGWDDAMLVLAHEIDPAGAMKIWTRPRPKLNPQIPLEEGLLSGWMLNPRQAGTVETGESLASVLLGTLARINKYGEPEYGLRSACLAVLRFAADDLAHIPISAAESNPKALALRAFAFRARNAVVSQIGSASPRFLRNRRGPNPYSETMYGTELDLDLFDLANASFDVYAAPEPNLPPPRFAPHEDDRNRVVDALAELAAARSVFGGNPVSPSQESVACRAFSTLVAWADSRAPDSRPIRDELENIVDNQIVDVSASRGDEPALNAARAAFLWAGLANQAEADERIRWLIERGIQFNPIQPVEAATTLRAIPLYAGGPGRDTFRGYASSKIGEWIDELDRRNYSRHQPDGTSVGGVSGSRQEKQFLDAWKAAAGRVTLASINPTCGPEPAKERPTFLLYAQTTAGLQAIKDLYVGVPTIVEVQFKSAYGKPEYEFELSAGGSSRKLKAMMFDRQRRIYRTAPILPVDTKEEAKVSTGKKGTP